MGKEKSEYRSDNAEVTNSPTGYDVMIFVGQALPRKLVKPSNIGVIGYALSSGNEVRGLSQPSCATRKMNMHMKTSTGASNGKPKQVTTGEYQGVDRQFADYLFPFVYRLRFAIIIGFLVVQGAFAYFASQLPPLSGTEEFLPDDFILRKAEIWQEDFFRV